MNPLNEAANVKLMQQQKKKKKPSLNKPLYSGLKVTPAEPEKLAAELPGIPKQPSLGGGSFSGNSLKPMQSPVKATTNPLDSFTPDQPSLEPFGGKSIGDLGTKGMYAAAPMPTVNPPTGGLTPTMGQQGANWKPAPGTTFTMGQQGANMNPAGGGSMNQLIPSALNMLGSRPPTQNVGQNNLLGQVQQFLQQPGQQTGNPFGQLQQMMQQFMPQQQGQAQAPATPQQPSQFGGMLGVFQGMPPGVMGDQWGPSPQQQQPAQAPAQPPAPEPTPDNFDYEAQKQRLDDMIAAEEAQWAREGKRVGSIVDPNARLTPGSTEVSQQLDQAFPNILGGAQDEQTVAPEAETGPPAPPVTPGPAPKNAPQDLSVPTIGPQDPEQAKPPIQYPKYPHGKGAPVQYPKYPHGVGAPAPPAQPSVAEQQQVPLPARQPTPMPMPAPQQVPDESWRMRFEPQIRRARAAGNTREVRRLERMQAIKPDYELQASQRAQRQAEMDAARASRGFMPAKIGMSVLEKQAGPPRPSYGRQVWNNLKDLAGRVGMVGSGVGTSLGGGFSTMAGLGLKALPGTEGRTQAIGDYLFNKGQEVARGGFSDIGEGLNVNQMTLPYTDSNRRPIKRPWFLDYNQKNLRDAFGEGVMKGDVTSNRMYNIADAAGKASVLAGSSLPYAMAIPGGTVAGPARAIPFTRGAVTWARPGTQVGLAGSLGRLGKFSLPVTGAATAYYSGESPRYKVEADQMQEEWAMRQALAESEKAKQEALDKLKAMEGKSWSRGDLASNIKEMGSTAAKNYGKMSPWLQYGIPAGLLGLLALAISNRSKQKRDEEERARARRQPAPVAQAALPAPRMNPQMGGGESPMAIINLMQQPRWGKQAAVWAVGDPKPAGSTGGLNTGTVANGGVTSYGNDALKSMDGYMNSAAKSNSKQAELIEQCRQRGWDADRTADYIYNTSKLLGAVA